MGARIGVRKVTDDAATRVTSLREVLIGAPIGTECLVIIYGANIGRKFEMIEDVITIGRDPDSSIVLESDAVSRRHARIERLKDARYVIDLNSTNGTYVNDASIKRCKLEPGVLLKIGDTIFKYLAGTGVEAMYFEEIYRMTVSDGLTQIANKRALDEFLDKEVARARRHDRALSVLMLDIDHFKSVNDTYGHLTGDVVLRDLAAIVKKRIRREELFARYGGEEFCVVLPETDLQAALEFAEVVRALVAQNEVHVEDQKLRVTISIGVAQFRPSEHRTPEDLLKAADKALYVAKAEGRNRVHG
jgi:diguanylate cyclase (GGDEF)-like protein